MQKCDMFCIFSFHKIATLELFVILNFFIESLVIYIVGITKLLSLMLGFNCLLFVGGFGCGKNKSSFIKSPPLFSLLSSLTHKVISFHNNTYETHGLNAMGSKRSRTAICLIFLLVMTPPQNILGHIHGLASLK